MKSFLTTEQIAKVLKRIFLYICLYVAVVILEKISPTGPCTPGLGIIAAILLIPLTLIFTLTSLVRTISENKNNWPVTLVHLIAALTLYYFIWLN